MTFPQIGKFPNLSLIGFEASDKQRKHQSSDLTNVQNGVHP